MSENAFNIQLSKELEQFKLQFSGTSFIHWHDLLSETVVVTVIPDTCLDTDDFINAEFELHKRMYALYPEMVITFRTKDDLFFPYPAIEIDNTFSGYSVNSLITQNICNPNPYTGIEQDILVSANSEFIGQRATVLAATKSLSNPHDVNYNVTLKQEYCLAS